MELASVSSIGGGAVAFFPTPITQFYAERSRTMEPFENGVIRRCEKTARQMMGKKAEIYGAVEGISGTSRRGALFCRSGTWLEVLDERTAAGGPTVRGTIGSNSLYGVLDFISVAIGLITIRGVESDSYVCMNSSGALYAAPPSKFSDDCVFMEQMMENYYNIYSSCRFGTRRRPWYMAISRSGMPINATETRRGRKAGHFLVVHYDESSSTVRDVGLANFLKLKTESIPDRPNQTRIPTPPSPQKLLEREARRKQRRKKKRHRQERLRREEQLRQRRREQLERFRLEEQQKKRQQIRSEPVRLSGSGYQIRPRRPPAP